MINEAEPSLESQRATLCVRVAEARAALRAAIHEREIFDSTYPEVLTTRIEFMSVTVETAASHTGPRKAVGPRSARRASKRLARGLDTLIGEVRDAEQMPARGVLSEVQPDTPWPRS